MQPHTTPNSLPTANNQRTIKPKDKKNAYSGIPTQVHHCLPRLTLLPVSPLGNWPTNTSEISVYSPLLDSPTISGHYKRTEILLMEDSQPQSSRSVTSCGDAVKKLYTWSRSLRCLLAMRHEAETRTSWWRPNDCVINNSEIHAPPYTNAGGGAETSLHRSVA